MKIGDRVRLKAALTGHLGRGLAMRVLPGCDGVVTAFVEAKRQPWWHAPRDPALPFPAHWLVELTVANHLTLTATVLLGQEAEAVEIIA